MTQGCRSVLKRVKKGMLKTRIPAVTGGLKFRIWDALRVEAQKRGLPVAGFVRRVFLHAMQHTDMSATAETGRTSSSLSESKTLPGLLQDETNKS